MRTLLATCVLAACTAASSAQATPTAARYLALGDSFTIGTGSTPEQAFPARLVTRSACGATLRNVAVNGYSTADVIARELPEVPAFAPTFVTFAAGANDIVRGGTPEQYRANVRAILAALRKAGVRHVVTLPQPDWSRSPAAQYFGDPGAILARIVEANAILRDETTAAGGTYVDLFPMMQTQAAAGWIARDGLHPSAAAHDAWAAELMKRGITPCGP